MQWSFLSCRGHEERAKCQAHNGPFDQRGLLPDRAPLNAETATCLRGHTQGRNVWLVAPSSRLSRPPDHCLSLLLKGLPARFIQFVVPSCQFCKDRFINLPIIEVLSWCGLASKCKQANQHDTIWLHYLRVGLWNCWLLWSNLDYLWLIPIVRQCSVRVVWCSPTVLEEDSMANVNFLLMF